MVSDFRSPNCDRYCSTSPRIRDVKDRVNSLGQFASAKGCTSYDGELTCDGPVIVPAVSAGGDLGWGFGCRASCETPNLVNVADVVQATAITTYVERVMGEVFEIK